MCSIAIGWTSQSWISCEVGRTGCSIRYRGTYQLEWSSMISCWVNSSPRRYRVSSWTRRWHPSWRRWVRSRTRRRLKASCPSCSTTTRLYPLLMWVGTFMRRMISNSMSGARCVPMDRDHRTTPSVSITWHLPSWSRRRRRHSTIVSWGCSLHRATSYLKWPVFCRS